MIKLIKREDGYQVIDTPEGECELNEGKVMPTPEDAVTAWLRPNATPEKVVEFLAKYCIQERQHGDVIEHHHDNCEYWHPVARVHKGEFGNLPISGEHVRIPCVPEPPVHGLPVKSFNWVQWDAKCHAKGICQGYTSIQRHDKKCPNCHLTHTSGNQYPVQVMDTHCIDCKTELKEYVYPELHHRAVTPELQGIAETNWQCPHCRQLQKPIQWAQRARLETYQIAQRGIRTVLWLKVSSGAWFVLIVKAYRSIQAVASNNGECGTAYYCGIPGVSEGKPPLQMPDEIAITLARRFWYKITKGAWSDVPREDEE